MSSLGNSKKREMPEITEDFSQKAKRLRRPIMDDEDEIIVIKHEYKPNEKPVVPPA
jgi:hypothetical protein